MGRLGFDVAPYTLGETVLGSLKPLIGWLGDDKICSTCHKGDVSLDTLHGNVWRVQMAFTSQDKGQCQDGEQCLHSNFGFVRDSHHAHRRLGIHGLPHGMHHAHVVHAFAEIRPGARGFRITHRRDEIAFHRPASLQLGGNRH